MNLLFKPPKSRKVTVRDAERCFLPIKYADKYLNSTGVCLPDLTQSKRELLCLSVTKREKLKKRHPFINALLSTY